MEIYLFTFRRFLKEKKIREAYKFHFNFLLECLQIYFNAPPALYQGEKKCNLSLLVCISPCQLPSSGVSDTSPCRAGQGHWMSLTSGRGGAGAK